MLPEYKDLLHHIEELDSGGFISALGLLKDNTEALTAAVRGDGDGEDGTTLLHACCRSYPHISPEQEGSLLIIAKALVAAGADVNAVDKYGSLCAASAVSAGLYAVAEFLAPLTDIAAYPCAADGSWRHPLSASSATMYDNAEALEWWDAHIGAANGVTPELRERAALTLLRGAAYSASARCLRYLIERYKDLGLAKKRCGGRNGTALHIAANSAAHMHRRPEAVRVLLEAGSELETRDGRGNTPLLCAAKNGTFRIVKELLDAGASPFATDNEGRALAEAIILNKNITALETVKVWNACAEQGALPYTDGNENHETLLAGEYDGDRLAAMLDALKAAYKLQAERARAVNEGRGGDGDFEI